MIDDVRFNTFAGTEGRDRGQREQTEKQDACTWVVVRVEDSAAPTSSSKSGQGRKGRAKRETRVVAATRN